MIRPHSIRPLKTFAAASLLFFPMVFQLPSSAQALPGAGNIPEDVERLQGKSLDHPPDLVHPSVNPATAPDLSPPGLLKSVDLAIPSTTTSPETGETLPALMEKEILADPDLPSRLDRKSVV